MFDRKQLYDFLRESIGDKIEASDDNINKVADELTIPTEVLAYEQMLKEMNKAKEALRNCSRSYHYGYERSLISKGFDAYGTDSRTTFKSKDGVFWFTVAAWSDWKFPNKTEIEADDEKVSLRTDSKENFISDWRRKGLIRKDLKCKNKVQSYKGYWVIDSDTDKILKKFDDFEEAKKYAYEEADKECKRGSALRDSTSRYYHSKPLDVTKYYQPYLAYYEYYEYSEHSYGICVQGIK